MKKYISKLSSIVQEAVITGISSALLYNDIGNISFEKISPGQYLCKSNGLFSLDRTAVRIQPSDGTSSPATAQFHAHVLNPSSILIYSMDQADNCVEADFRYLDFEITNY